MNSKLIIKYSLIVVLFFSSMGLKAQIVENTQATSDTLRLVPEHSPKKAALLSTFIPGAGQIYNKKYWKLPFLYGGMVLCGYAAVWNQGQYTIYSDAFDLRQSGQSDPFEGIYNDEQLIQIQNYYNKNKELSIVIGVGLYAISFLDANVDAHLYDFDISDDLSLRIEPASFKIENSPLVYSGVKLKIKF